MPSKKKAKRRDKQSTNAEHSIAKNIAPPSAQLDSKEARRQERIRGILQDPDSLTGGKLIRTIPDFKERFVQGKEQISTLEIEEELFRLSSPETKLKIKCVPKDCEYDDYYSRVGRALVEAVVGASESGPEVRILKNILEAEIEDGMDQAIWEADEDFDRAGERFVESYKNRLSPYMEWNIRTLMREHLIWPELKQRVRKYTGYISRICFDSNKKAFEGRWKPIHSLSTLDEFIVMQNCLLDSVQWKLDLNRHYNLLRAATEVGFGAHVDEVSCWECGKRKTEYHCTICETARYCNEECQWANWSKAHKVKCKEMKELYKLYQEGLAAIVASHSAPEVHETKYGVKPSPMDSTIASKGIEIGILDDCARKANSVRDNASGLSGPSMENFYRNVKHVTLDSFWFCSIAAEENGAVQRNDLETNDFWLFWNGIIEKTREDFISIAAALMYDYSKSDGTLNRDAFSDKVKSIMGNDLSRLAACRTKSVRNWLVLYPDHEEGSEVDLVKLQRVYKRRIFDQMRNQNFGDHLSALCKQIEGSNVVEEDKLSVELGAV